MQRLARTLFSTLSASYLECAPVVFSPSVNPPDTDLQMLTAAMEITRTLYGVILQSGSQVRTPFILMLHVAYLDWTRELTWCPVATS